MTNPAPRAETKSVPELNLQRWNAYFKLHHFLSDLLMTSYLANGWRSRSIRGSSNIIKVIAASKSASIKVI